MTSVKETTVADLPLPLDTLTRRELLGKAGMGMASLGLAGLLASESAAAPLAAERAASPLAPRKPHFAPRVKRVIHLFMNGGPFGPDFFDLKPDLNRFAGQRPAEARRVLPRHRGGTLRC